MALVKCPQCDQMVDDQASNCPKCGALMPASASQTTAGYGTPTPKVSFLDAVKICFSKYATFTGRARRSEYWFFNLFTFLVNLVLSITVILIPLTYVFGLVVLLPGLAVSVRRLHDLNKSGWNLLFGLIPIVGAILLLVWFCGDSKPGTNEYGPSEKYPN